jgi:hypothetical protein
MNDEIVKNNKIKENKKIENINELKRRNGMLKMVKN